MLYAGTEAREGGEGGEVGKHEIVRRGSMRCDGDEGDDVMDDGADLNVILVNLRMSSIIQLVMVYM